MRHIILPILIWLSASVASAFEIEARAFFGTQADSETIRILSTADINYFTPVIESFRAFRPDLAIEYTVASSTEVMDAIVREKQPFDIVISSAMDLQTKLANDGLAREHISPTTQNLPDWAVWNDMVYAFTQEPAGFVISNALFDGLPIPQNRQKLSPPCDKTLIASKGVLAHTIFANLAQAIYLQPKTHVYQIRIGD